MKRIGSILIVMGAGALAVNAQRADLKPIANGHKDAAATTRMEGHSRLT